jgi:outer membrane protein assembly factor BamA
MREALSPLSLDVARWAQYLAAPLDRDLLRADIENIYALDYFEIVDFKVVSQAGRSGLEITATEKAWGSDDIKFGLNLITDLKGGASVSWRYDNVDGSFFPRNGSFLCAEYELNHKDLGSDESFERWHMLGF